MITLDQIKQLDFKVRKAIDKINSLKSANNILQEKLDTYQIRIEELEILIDTFKEDQGEIEHGIIDALNQLDILEDNIITPSENTLIEQDSSETDNKTIESVQEDITEKEELEEIVNQEHPSDEKDEVDEEEVASGDSEVELDIF